ncbi:hypothetical protein QBC37DRAFT_141896 [Rhypophila decipiens]|uniref:Uncharacterized protein n=1 Tax=Rhypophila decipiens TaxID=261697 RepID=A0AAN6YBD0_9PEZI|nr:hypothetical protein QBC37DRAFT_141896 [Rhypophila decipiens]
MSDSSPFGLWPNSHHGHHQIETALVGQCAIISSFISLLSNYYDCLWSCYCRFPLAVVLRWRAYAKPKLVGMAKGWSNDCFKVDGNKPPMQTSTWLSVFIYFASIMIYAVQSLISCPPLSSLCRSLVQKPLVA